METVMDPNVLHPVLYTPATTPIKKLWKLTNGENPAVRRMVICTEDSVSELDLPDALVNIRRVLPGIHVDSPTKIFIRVRNPGVLNQVLNMPDIEKITGIVVPKADPKGFLDYAQPVADHGRNFRLMPILESPQMPDRYYRHDLLQVMMDDRYRSSIDCLRIGANDLMGHQGLRRADWEYTIYESVIGSLIDDIVNEFRGIGGFTVTAPVFECFGSQYDDLFRREVRRNILNNLYGQTVIHLRHLPMLLDMYRVRSTDFASAKTILESEAAINGQNGKMDEKSTHDNWAHKVMVRQQQFGLS